MAETRDIPASELRTHLGAVLDAVRAGETIGVTHRGARIANIVPEADAAARRLQALDGILAFLAEHAGHLPKLDPAAIKALIDEGRRN